MKTSIVIPVWNALPYLKKAVDSIRKFTADYELVLVDNNSRSDCVEYIRSIDCVKIFNASNLGPGEAMNQGIKASSGEFICLMNSDTQATENWLPPLIATLRADPQIGVVAPLCDNSCSVQTCMALKNYYPICLMKGYILPFMCALFPRHIFTRRGVGLLATRFRAGNSEDSEFCIRLDRAGYLKAVCTSSFIPHALSQSYRDNGVDNSAACRDMSKLLNDFEEIEYLEA